MIYKKKSTNNTRILVYVKRVFCCSSRVLYSRTPSPVVSIPVEGRERRARAGRRRPLLQHHGIVGGHAGEQAAHARRARQHAHGRRGGGATGRGLGPAPALALVLEYPPEH